MFSSLTSGSGPVQLLIVEDNPGDVILVKEALSKGRVKFEVTDVGLLAEALQRLATARVDLVILDLGLPDSSGLDTLQKIRDAAPDKPVIVLTGVLDETLAMGALRQGAQDYLVKDLTEWDLLVHSVCHAIERHQLHAELNQARQQQLENQKLESLAMLAGGIAHDFNNLLTVVLGRADMEHRKAATPSDTKESLEQIKQAGARAAELCKQLLAYSGKTGIVPRPCDLGPLIAELVPILRRSLPEHVAIECQAASPLPAIMAEPSQIRQMVMNLVQNAAEALGSEPGTITIGTGVVRADRNRLGRTFLGNGLTEGDYVCLTIRDTGCGMAPSVQKRMLEPFFSTKTPGRGLGLAAVQGIIRACNGTLEFVSEPGRGSTFNVLFPALRAPAAAATTLRASADNWRGRGTVLVVDDEESIRELLGAMVKEMGFQVLYANDGLDGVENYRSHSAEIDLVLLDMTMPQVNGKQAFKKIRQIKPDARIILMSGYTKEECASLFGEDGLSGFMQKPFRFGDLRNQIHATLDA